MDLLMMGGGVTINGELLTIIFTGIAIVLGAWSKIESARAISKEEENEKAIEALNIANKNLLSDNGRLATMTADQDERIRELQRAVQEHERYRNELTKEILDKERALLLKDAEIIKLRGRIEELENRVNKLLKQ